MAWLHDMIEDTDISSEYLLAAGTPERLGASVELLTRKPGVPYFDYIQDILVDRVARRVKTADVMDNLERSLEGEDNRIRRMKYMTALHLLLFGGRDY